MDRVVGIKLAPYQIIMLSFLFQVFWTRGLLEGTRELLEGFLSQKAVFFS